MQKKNGVENKFLIENEVNNMFNNSRKKRCNKKQK